MRTAFDYPGFQRMIADIEAKKVNMVLTKDLSRSGRDYILTGHYMERYFPEHRVRCISLPDGLSFCRKRCPKSLAQQQKGGPGHMAGALFLRPGVPSNP